MLPAIIRQRCVASANEGFHFVTLWSQRAGRRLRGECQHRTTPRGGDQTLADTVARARQQIEDRRYAASLEERGIAPERIRTYGIAFCGKEALVG